MEKQECDSQVSKVGELRNIEGNFKFKVQTLETNTIPNLLIFASKKKDSDVTILTILA